MNTADFDYYLPEGLIANEPVAPRDHSRLLHLNKSNGEISHYHFFDLINLIPSNSVLVFNDTKVIPARLHGKKKDKDKIIEILIVKYLAEKNCFSCLAKPGKKLKPGDIICFVTNKNEVMTLKALEGIINKKNEDGTIEISFNVTNEELTEYLQYYGELPLAPYITKKLDDNNKYQTCYAKKEGSIAAPTAGLHFTNELLEKLKMKNIALEFIELQVGLGTFLPMKVLNVKDHKMHSELININKETANNLNQYKKAGRKIYVVGTTTCRALESAANETGEIIPIQKETDIFIYPGYKFKFVEKLITNFHLPKSTLLMLISALAGQEKIKNAYAEAIAKKYRFYSFGDAMLID